MAWAAEEEEQKGEARYDMAAKIKERFAEKMPEGNDHQNSAQRRQGFADSQAEKEQSTAD
jgi:hypothetical protein